MIFLDFSFHFHETTKFGHVGMMCIIFINILNTVSLDIFVGTVKQIVKFIRETETETQLKKRKKEKKKSP